MMSSLLNELIDVSNLSFKYDSEKRRKWKLAKLLKNTEVWLSNWYYRGLFFRMDLVNGSTLQVFVNDQWIDYTAEPPPYDDLNVLRELFIQIFGEKELYYVFVKDGEDYYEGWRRSL